MLHKKFNEIDGGVPRGNDWHLQLLHRMLAPVPETRPPVIDVSLGEELAEFMRFRHVFRHQYGFELRWQLVKDLADRMEEVHRRFAGQIRTFELWLRTADGPGQSAGEA